jgi:hypothetical protein
MTIMRNVKKLTKITPRWSHVPHMPVPYEGVDGVDDAKQECGQDQSEGGDISCS